MKPIIYISAPYSKPDPCINTFNAIEAANWLLELGFVPFVPHLTHFWHTMTPKSYEEWLRYDLEFMPICKAVLRLPGESAGADKEIQHAKELGIPIYFGKEQFEENIRVFAHD